MPLPEAPWALRHPTCEGSAPSAITLHQAGTSKERHNPATHAELCEPRLPGSLPQPSPTAALPCSYRQMGRCTRGLVWTNQHCKPAESWYLRRQGFCTISATALSAQPWAARAYLDGASTHGSAHNAGKICRSQLFHLHCKLQLTHQENSE